MNQELILCLHGWVLESASWTVLKSVNTLRCSCERNPSCRKSPGSRNHPILRLLSQAFAREQKALVFPTQFQLCFNFFHRVCSHLVSFHLHHVDDCSERLSKLICCYSSASICFHSSETLTHSQCNGTEIKLKEFKCLN